MKNKLKKLGTITVREDSNTAVLKEELKRLEQELQDISNEQNDYYNNVNRFYFEYNLKLGDLIQSILYLNQQLLKKKYESKADIHKLYKQLQQDKKNLADTLKSIDFKELDSFLLKLHELQSDYNNIKDELEEIEELSSTYNEAKNDYEEFKNDYEEQLKDTTSKLNITDTKELKSLYRKACKICHPDIVLESLRDDANEIMQELNSSYSKNDLSHVKKILASLKNGKKFTATSETVDNYKLLANQISSIKEKIQEISLDLEAIYQDEDYELIMNQKKWKSYFITKEKELQKEHNSLEKLL